MDQIKQIHALIARHKHFIIVSHYNPDADALASCLVMGMFLKSLGKKMTIVNEDAMPQWLAFLPRTQLLKKASSLKKCVYDAAIILDCGDRERIGSVEKLLVPDKPIVNIDHHISNKGFGNVNWIDPKASSTCEMVYELIYKRGFKLNKAAATLLYAGIMTDTGSFRYENTTARVHAIVSQLMGYGINAQDLYQRLYVGIPVADMKLFTQVIHEAQLLLGGKVYSVSLPAKLNNAFSKSFDLKDKLFGFLRSVEGIEVVVILTELNSKETRINLRSQSNFNVAKLAMCFNGGGHTKAAGAKIYDSLAVAQEQILNAIKKDLK